MAHKLRWRFFQNKGAMTVILWCVVTSLGICLTDYWLSAVGSSIPGTAIFISIIILYPVIGLLGDVCVKRHNLVMFSLWVQLIAMVIATIVPTLKFSDKHLSVWLNDLLISIFNVVVVLGQAAFQVTAIQFGTDQLQGAPSEHISSFICWYFWMEILAKLVTEWIAVVLAYFIKDKTSTTIAWSLVEVCLFTVVLSTKTCFKSHWFLSREPGEPNPYKITYRVLKFACKHNHPIQRSALTYWEDSIPSRIDLGKNKYGGPFSVEEVESVKTCLHLIRVMISLLGTLVALQLIEYSLQGVLWNFTDHPGSSFSLHHVLLTGASIDVVILGLLIPLHELVIFPLFQRYLPSMLKRIWIGALLVVISSVSILLIDATGHKMNSYAIPCPHPSTSPTMELNPYIVLIPKVLYGLSYTIFSISLIEFIIAQSPESMWGMLIGVYYSIRVGLAGCLYLIFGYVLKFHTSKQEWLSCGVVYSLLFTVIAFLSLIAFTIAAYKYKRRRRDDVVNIHIFAEEYYSK